MVGVKVIVGVKVMVGVLVGKGVSVTVGVEVGRGVLVGVLVGTNVGVAVGPLTNTIGKYDSDKALSAFVDLPKLPNTNNTKPNNNTKSNSLYVLFISFLLFPILYTIIIFCQVAEFA